MARLCLDAWWVAGDLEQHARADALVPLRRLFGAGWLGWPAYIAAIGLLRAIA